ncbi:hypothetical protein OAI51_01815 [Candidatus Pelagibacter bacterium]|nr:hypothetical protein [Candidatus Pelagibacter bacterium]|tara:strand:+ start:93 stop:518 length:426 start_codon:yes stop_codon:yes gene_type:complete
MKNILTIITLSLLFTNVASASDRYGRGELQLSKGMADYFIKYIRGERGKKPSDFYVTLDGKNGIFWYCSAASSCSAGVLKDDLEDCERKTGKQCKKFAFKRSIKWKNNINPGKGKISKFNSKMTDAEIYNKLTELGFYNNK